MRDFWVWFNLLLLSFETAWRWVHTALVSVRQGMQSLQHIHLIRHLAEQSWTDLWVHFITGPWGELFVGIKESAALISSLATIFGVTYYFRQTKKYSTVLQNEALLDIIKLTVELKRHIQRLHNSERITEANEQLYRFIQSKENVFEHDTRKILLKNRNKIYTLAKRLEKLDKSIPLSVENRADADKKYQECFDELDKKLYQFKTETALLSKSLIQLIDRIERIQM